MVSTWPSAKPLLLSPLWRSWGPHQFGLSPITQLGQSPVRGSPSIQAPNLGSEEGVTAGFFLGSGRLPESVMNTVLAGVFPRGFLTLWVGEKKLKSSARFWVAP